MRFTTITFLLSAILLTAACSPPPPAEPAAPVAEPIVLPVSAGGETCGGIAALQCEEGFFCRAEAGLCVTTADYAGTCQKISAACTREYAPVCGCNGKTYPNTCEAHADATSVATTGACTG